MDEGADELLESRLQGNLTAVAEARIFIRTIDKMPLLTGTEVAPRLTIDDGRVFDLAIFPVRINLETSDEISEHYGHSLLSMDEVGLLIAVLGFEYTNYGSLFAGQRYWSAKLNMSEPGYSYSVLAVSRVLFDPLEVADRFAQTIAENLDQNVGNARRVEIGEDGRQGVQQLLKPNTTSIYELKRQELKRL